MKTRTTNRKKVTKSQKTKLRPRAVYAACGRNRHHDWSVLLWPALVGNQEHHPRLQSPTPRPMECRALADLQPDVRLCRIEVVKRKRHSWTERPIASALGQGRFRLLATNERGRESTTTGRHGRMAVAATTASRDPAVGLGFSVSKPKTAIYRN